MVNNHRISTILRTRPLLVFLAFSLFSHFPLAASSIEMREDSDNDSEMVQASKSQSNLGDKLDIDYTQIKEALEADVMNVDLLNRILLSGVTSYPKSGGRPQPYERIFGQLNKGNAEKIIQYRSRSLDSAGDIPENAQITLVGFYQFPYADMRSFLLEGSEVEENKFIFHMTHCDMVKYEELPENMQEDVKFKIAVWQKHIDNRVGSGEYSTEDLADHFGKFDEYFVHYKEDYENNKKNKLKNSKSSRHEEKPVKAKGKVRRAKSSKQFEKSSKAKGKVRRAQSSKQFNDSLIFKTSQEESKNKHVNNSARHVKNSSKAKGKVRRAQSSKQFNGSLIFKTSQEESKDKRVKSSRAHKQSSREAERPFYSVISELCEVQKESNSNPIITLLPDDDISKEVEGSPVEESLQHKKKKSKKKNHSKGKNTRHFFKSGKKHKKHKKYE